MAVKIIRTVLDMINGFGEMISITVVTNTQILVLDMINDFTENLLGPNCEIGWQELWKLFTM